MKNYSLSSCESLVDKYINGYGGELFQIDEGILGLGTLILHGAEGKKTVIIKEFYINPWVSGHSVTKYNKIPKKYLKLINS